MTNATDVLDMYRKYPSYVIGFHGCSKKTYEKIIYLNKTLEPSKNKYDWLGNGVYFWENDYQRALEWANNRYGEEAAVIGAFIDLGYCLNLASSDAIDILKISYEQLKALFESRKEELPKNESGGKSKDELIRNLDCSIIQNVHEYNKSQGYKAFDTVRGLFTEGDEAYPGAGFTEKAHIQIAIRNPNCIRGYFSPRKIDFRYNLP